MELIAKKELVETSLAHIEASGTEQRATTAVVTDPERQFIPLIYVVFRIAVFLVRKR
jgi:hypothetical protein